MVTTFYIHYMTTGSKIYYFLSRISFYLCSQKQYWCRYCSLGPYYSGKHSHVEQFFLVFPYFVLLLILILCPSLCRYTSWIVRFGMQYFPQYLEVYMVHSAALERYLNLRFPFSLSLMIPLSLLFFKLLTDSDTGNA